MNRKFFLVLAAIFLIPAGAYAMYTLCPVASWFTSGTGKALATLLSLIIIITAAFRKIKWYVAAILIVMIFLFFGSGEIIEAISANPRNNNCNNNSGNDVF